MSKRLSSSSRLAPVADLFDMAPVAPVRVPVSSGSALPAFTPEQQRNARLVADCLRRDIARLHKQLASPLASAEEYDHQVIEANADLGMTAKCLVDFLPADLQPLLAQFLDLRAQIVVRICDAQKDL